MHYQCLTPQHFVLPFLHIEIGMENQVWEDLEEWNKDTVEIISSHEKNLRKKLKDAIKNCEVAIADKME